jgi:uncharacterized protein
MVNESGASIYSASEIARQEFPDHDLTVRGAVSIGRRLMDPLSELVKIDPKSIGVGQYQHDVDQFALKKTLDDVVISCVNGVGVEVNRASVQLLTYVSGLGPQLARNIVAHRDEHGAFTGRDTLKKVKRLGPKAFEQCAGFLRIKNGENPLDASAVHPESYPVVQAMANDLGCSVSDLMNDAGLRKKIDLNRYTTETIGLPTLTDIMDELAKPGRDPREPFELFSFDENVSKIQDLEPGMRLPGIVTNVTNFGAFVDIGVHQDGLVHISELCDRFVKTPADVVAVQQKVTVTVMAVDLLRKRISLSMRSQPGKKSQPKAKTQGPRKTNPAASGTKPTANRSRQARSPLTILLPMPFVKRRTDRKASTMIAVVQRVSSSSVTIDGAVVGAIGPGLNVLLGVAEGDEKADADYLSAKVAHLRIFEDDRGRMNRSLVDTGGQMIVVSQFTLLGDCRKGRRPSFVHAAEPVLPSSSTGISSTR